MRQAFIPATEAPTLQDAQNAAPWAAEIIEVDGGWQAFESVSDADVWRAQS